MAADAQTLHRARSGDRAAGDSFVRAHLDAVWRYARFVTRDEATAEDVVQETFLAALRGDTPLQSDSARGWLLTIARNASMRATRRRAGEPARFEPLDELGAAAGWGADPEAAVAAAEQRERLEAALGRLSEEDREVVLLRDVEGLDGPVVAELLGLEVGAMKSRLHRARLRLMAELRRGGVHAD